MYVFNYIEAEAFWCESGLFFLAVRYSTCDFTILRFMMNRRPVEDAAPLTQ